MFLTTAEQLSAGAEMVSGRLRSKRGTYGRRGNVIAGFCAMKSSTIVQDPADVNDEIDYLCAVPPEIDQRPARA